MEIEKNFIIPIRELEIISDTVSNFEEISNYEDVSNLSNELLQSTNILEDIENISQRLYLIKCLLERQFRFDKMSYEVNNIRNCVINVSMTIQEIYKNIKRKNDALVKEYNLELKKILQSYRSTY
ncbi:hypothetical protein [Clostridium ihumii]|uniref:hypothetical protein n=1 Tax=Clostridium ihumii TaxID=1470356 RepID=UPI000A5E8290|nr:hypothetical protein [Clostridium ihumii]